LWFEISALAIRKRSTAAMNRANSEDEGAKATEAVLDIGIPFLETVSLAVSFLGAIYVYQMPVSMPVVAWQHAVHRIAT
jgi:hypothetical protein